MAIIIRPKEFTIDDLNQPIPLMFQFYQVSKMNDINEIEVQVPILLGTYSLQDLELRKVVIQIQLDEVNEKIAAIYNSL
jgi:hypothetical protein